MTYFIISKRLQTLRNLLIRFLISILKFYQSKIILAGMKQNFPRHKSFNLIIKKKKQNVRLDQKQNIFRNNGLVRRNFTRVANYHIVGKKSVKNFQKQICNNGRRIPTLYNFQSNHSINQESQDPFFLKDYLINQFHKHKKERNTFNSTQENYLRDPQRMSTNNQQNNPKISKIKSLYQNYKKIWQSLESKRVSNIKKSKYRKSLPLYDNNYQNHFQKSQQKLKEQIKDCKPTNWSNNLRNTNTITQDYKNKIKAIPVLKKDGLKLQGKLKIQKQLQWISKKKNSTLFQFIRTKNEQPQKKTDNNIICIVNDKMIVLRENSN